MLLISNASLTKSSPVWERWEGEGCIYNSQCLELLVVTSASSTDIMGVWGTENGCRRKRQKSSCPMGPAPSNKSVLCKLALFNPKWGTDKSSTERCCREGSKEQRWPARREGTQQQHQDFFLGFPGVPGVGWLLDSCRRFLLFLAVLPVSWGAAAADDSFSKAREWQAALDQPRGAHSLCQSTSG